MQDLLIYKSAALEALYTISSKGNCDVDLAASVIDDLPDVHYESPLKKNDIVYILKSDIDSDELKYSIRSVVQNMPYARIVFYCGCPQDMEPDIMVPFVQTGSGKLEKTRSTFIDIMTNDDLTENIWLFNDDFFIMKPFSTERPICTGTLYDMILRIETQRKNRPSTYTLKLRRTAQYLQSVGSDTICYESHTPMLINRKKAQYILENFPSDIAFRSTYGNYYEIESILKPDVKVSRLEQEFDEDSELLSTNDTTFKQGNIGTYIRSIFSTPSKYELAAFEERTYCNTRI